ncbi:MAG: M20/M25/M40 family metallo-hydrolase, partial [Tepidiformaceae bacterium]
PHGDNCAEHLVRALERVSRWTHALRVTPVMRAHMEALEAAGVVRSSRDPDILAAAERNPALRARLGNTVSLTTIKTGIKVNVIPAEASATLDCRLLPDVDVDEFLADLAKTIDDSRVQMEVLNRYEGAESTLDAEFVQVASSVVAEMVEGATVAPEMTSGFTDSRIYRKLGIPAYGFVPCLVAPEELAGIHGHNERISVENLRLGMQVLYEVVKRMCAK